MGSILTDYFDAVLMLTWSDWKTEPRSNRYHYATRFARELPVLFFQHFYVQRDDLVVEPSGVPNIDIVIVSCRQKEKDINDIESLLMARGIKRPLLWIYDSMNYQPIIDMFPSAFRVYHATEDYLTKTVGWDLIRQKVGDSVVQLLSQIDFMVACSSSVAKSYVSAGGFDGPYAIIENGCDAEYYIEFSRKRKKRSKNKGKPIAIFQGGINQRLDYGLLLSLAKRMPDWEFRLCGNAIKSEGWRQLRAQGNVTYLGPLDSDDLAGEMLASTIGLIPYVQDEWIRGSFPLKAYEYIACGLPVVTVPITALEREPELIRIAKAADGFETAMRELAPTRFDQKMLDRRRKAALENSYSRRFQAMVERLVAERRAAVGRPRNLRVAILYDSILSLHVNTIKEHLESFENYSRFSIFYVPATRGFWNHGVSEGNYTIDFSPFDVIVVHYSVRLSIKEHLDEKVARAIERYHGLKILFIQDEYEGTEIARAWMERLRFDVVYTCASGASREYLYPSYRFPSVEFIQTLTGYVPDHQGIEAYAKPLSERTTMIAYRGRKLPAIYGELGYQKYRIGLEMKRIAAERGITVDIEVDESKRIYGPAWYAFLGSARATLGTESGANVVDFDGSLRQKIARLEAGEPGISYHEIAERVLSRHEGEIHMNQISPRVFEAIRLRTALVLFEGKYSGVIQPEVHYIPLKKDFSNVDEVLEKLSDDDYVSNLTDGAYQDIVASGRYAYRTFVEGIDRDINERVLHDRRDQVLLGALFAIKRDGAVSEVLPAVPVGLASGPHPLGCPMSAVEVLRASRVAQVPASAAHAGGGVGAVSTGDTGEGSGRSVAFHLARLMEGAMRMIWRLFPIGFRLRMLAQILALMRRLGGGRRKGILAAVLRGVWHLMPLALRARLARRLGLN